MIAPDFEPLIVARGQLAVVRLKHRADALEDYTWRRDPEIAKFDALDPITLSFTEYLDRVEQERRFPQPHRRNYSLMDPDGTHFGNIMYYNVSESRDAAEVGISIGLQPYRGQGRGTEAMILFVRYLWDTTTFRLLFLHTLDWNERAQRSFRKAGFAATARVIRGDEVFIRMEARREWWLMHEADGRFNLASPGHPVSH